MHTRPIIQTKRNLREWYYICERVGKSRAYEVLSRILKESRPYPAIIACELGITLPSESQLPWLPSERERLKQVARMELDKARVLLGMPRRSVTLH